MKILSLYHNSFNWLKSREEKAKAIDDISYRAINQKVMNKLRFRFCKDA
jgi:hypothetical protein